MDCCYLKTFNLYSRLSLSEVRPPRYTGHLVWHGMLPLCLCRWIEEENHGPRSSIGRPIKKCLEALHRSGMKSHVIPLLVFFNSLRMPTKFVPWSLLRQASEVRSDTASMCTAFTDRDTNIYITLANRTLWSCPT